MPKMKTHRGAAKRFKVKSSGTIAGRASNRNHMLSKRKTQAKRNLRAPGKLIAMCDRAAIMRMLRVRKIKKVKREAEHG